MHWLNYILVLDIERYTCYLIMQDAVYSVVDGLIYMLSNMQ